MAQARINGRASRPPQRAQAVAPRHRIRIPIRTAVLGIPVSTERDALTWSERRLMLATLEEGIRTLLGMDRSASPSWWRQEYVWITSRDREQPFAFESICAVFGLDADGIRRRVLASIGLG